MRVIGALVLLVLIAGCAGRAELVHAGFADAVEMRIPVTSAWNRLPRGDFSWARFDSQIWTVNGISLDRLILIPAVADGEPIYREQANRLNPPYRSTMQDRELAELLAASVEDAEGPGTRFEIKSAVRQQKFGTEQGLQFEFEVSVLDGPHYRGIASIVRREGRLYVAYFLAAEPYYYDTLVAAGRDSVLGVTF